jgi:hypothetical protein
MSKYIDALKEAFVSIEVYYCRLKRARPVTLQALTHCLTQAGFCCNVETEADELCWVTLAPHESTLLVNIAGQEVTFATLHFAFEDDFVVAQQIEEVMQSLRFSTREDEEYA